MPLLITPAVPFVTTAQVQVPSLYAILDEVRYQRKGKTPKRITAAVGYYASEDASTDPLGVQVDVPGLVPDFFQDATPEQANSLPIFEFLEALLCQRLQAVLPADTRIDTVA